MNLPKVLVASPTYHKKDYCFKTWSDNVKGFTYPNYDVLMVDNSPIDYHKKLSKHFKTIKVDRGNMNSVQALTASQNEIRAHFLQYNYDWLFMLESDVIPPKDIIEYFLIWQHAVHNISYFVQLNKFDNTPTLCLQSHCGLFGLYKNYKSAMVAPDEGGYWFNGEHYVFNEHGFPLQYGAGSGIGCTFIHRNVMQMVKFRDENTQVYSDTYFHFDLMRNNINDYMDGQMIVKHLTQKIHGRT